MHTNGKIYNKDYFHSLAHFTMNVTRVNITTHYLSWAPPPKAENYALDIIIIIIFILAIVILQLFARRNLRIQLRRAQTV